MTIELDDARFDNVRRGFILTRKRFPYKPMRVQWKADNRIGLTTFGKFEGIFPLERDEFDIAGYAILVEHE